MISIRCLERLINLKIKHDTNNRAHNSSKGDQKAAHAHGLNTNPLETPFRYLLLNNIHLDRKIHGQWPELESPNDPDHVVEEGEQHSDDGGEADEKRSPNESKEVDIVGAGGRDGELVVFGDEGGVGPCLGGFLLDESKDRLREDLVCANEVDDDGDVGDVEEPEWVVEAKASQEVAWGVVAKGCVAHATA